MVNEQDEMPWFVHFTHVEVLMQNILLYFPYCTDNPPSTENQTLLCSVSCAQVLNQYTIMQKERATFHEAWGGRMIQGSPEIFPSIHSALF